MILQANQRVLSSFLPDSALFWGDADIAVSGIKIDSRKIAAGDLFVAQKGETFDGLKFIDDAVRRGAVAVLAEKQPTNELPVPVACVENLDVRLSEIAAEFYDHPSRELSVTGITGTNGKTSCCYWYGWLSNELGRSCGQIGTLGAGYGDDKLIGLKPTGFTTPDPVSVQKLLADIKGAGAQAVVMEVSSHGLDQGRVSAVQYEAAVFTNLSQDHLDYHSDMDAYFDAKASLFERPELKRAVVNLDDSYSERLVERIHSSVDVYSFSLGESSADLFLESVEWTSQGAEVSINGRWGSAKAILPVIGDFNLSNLLAVTAASLASGEKLNAIISLLEMLPPVPGRMQIIQHAGLPRVLVDYAHTPDAVEKALRSIRQQVRGKLISVGGCGGDRDVEKRPLMGQFLSENSDQVWFTSDNPRSEDPEKIAQDMCADLSGDNYIVELNRKTAIKQAILSANSEDMVVVLGKGHENYQEINGEKLSHSDVEYSEHVLNELAFARGLQ